jgi:hypothetical protein
MNQLEQNAGPIAQSTVNMVARLSLLTGVGVLLGFITAIFGGLAGRPRSVVVEPEIVAGPTRLAA